MASRTTYFPLQSAPAGLAKYYDIAVAGNMTATPSVNLLTAITQGSGQGQRIGDVVYIRAIQWRYSVTTANSDVYNLARFIVFTWVPNTAALTPGTTSILEDTNTQGTLSFYNYEGRQDYHLHYDDHFKLTGTNTNPTIDSVHLVKGMFTFPGRGHCIQYNVGVTTGTHHLYTLVVSDSAITPFPYMTCWIRVWFTDV